MNRLKKEDKLRRFYEAYGGRRTANCLELDYDRASAEWKVENLIGLLLGTEFLRGNERLTPNVVEFGCGSGQVLRALVRELGSVRPVGVDISMSQLIIAKQEVPSGSFICGNVGSICLKKIQCALLIDVLEHFIDPIKVLKVVKEISKYILIKVPLEKAWVRTIQRFITGESGLGLDQHRAGHLYAWSRRDALSMLKKAGLEPLKAFSAVPNERIHYHELFANRSNGFKAITKKHKALLIVKAFLERALWRNWSYLHMRVYGSGSLFVLCVGRSEGRG